MSLSSPKDQVTSQVVDPLAVDTMKSLRQRILNNLTVVASIAGLAIYILQAVRGFPQIPLAPVIMFTALIVLVLVITLFRKLPYYFRVISLLAVIYFLSVSSYIQGGLTADGAGLILTFAFIGALLVGPWGAMATGAISMLTLALLGFLMSSGRILPIAVNDSTELTAWVSRGAILLLLATSIGMSVSTILRGLNANLKKASLIAVELEKGQANLRQHTSDLERRSLQIRTAAEISRSISGVLTPEKLLQDSVELIQSRFNLYYVGIFLLDELQRFAILQAGTGEAGKAMLAEGHKLAVAESSMVGWTVIHRQARIALDVGEEAVRFANPYLPETHSELALPLISGDRVVGALTIQSNQVRAFDQDDISILQNISDTLAISLDNARLFQETQSALEELRNTQRAYVSQAWTDISREKDEYEYNSSSPAPAVGEMAAIDVPLTLREQTIGQLHLEGSQDWTPEEHSLIEAIASQAALAMENARLLQESQQAALRERLVTEITSKVWSAPNTEYILQTALKELARALHADDAIIKLDTE